jgi:hypothetical protein
MYITVLYKLNSVIFITDLYAINLNILSSINDSQNLNLEKILSYKCIKYLPISVKTTVLKTKILINKIITEENIQSIYFLMHITEEKALYTYIY